VLRSAASKVMWGGRARILAFGFILVALVVAGLLLAAKPAHAAEFIVNKTSDEADLNAGDGKCDVSFRGSLGEPDPCTLRAAIEQANSTSGADTIKFNIPESLCHPTTKVCTITPVTELPTITEPVVIDGYTQPGAITNAIEEAKGGTDAVLKIELDGSGGDSASGSRSGLRIGAPNSVVRGLVINRFSYSGISITNQSKGVRVEGNFIGTDPSGTQALGNFYGIQDTSSGSTIGGTSREARNLISGNIRSGVILFDLFFNDSAAGHKILGNLIGIQRSGPSSALGNGVDGVRIDIGTYNNIVGGVESGAANIIAFNGVSGVSVNGGNGNRILSNSIFSNGGLGIDLGSHGRTFNDPKDPDTGPNNLQNFPVLTGYDSSTNTITGTLNSNPSVKKKRNGRTRIVRSYYTIQFFSNPPGGDEGKTYLGQKTVATNLSGNASFSFTPPLIIAWGHTITATATRRSTGDTSEFSDPLTVG
jgi:CSLREA domain-containing protein